MQSPGQRLSCNLTAPFPCAKEVPMEQTQLQHGSQFHLCKHTDAHIRVYLYTIHCRYCSSIL